MIARATRLFVVSICLVGICALIAQAQDAGQVLRLSVGFNTVRNTNASTMNEHMRAEIDRLSKAAQQANGEGKYGEALKHLYHGLAIMRGQEWTPAVAFSTALTIKLERAVIEPAEMVGLRLGQLFSPDERLPAKPSVSVSLLKLKGDEQVGILKTLDSIEADLNASPMTLKLSIPSVPDGDYRIAVKVQLPENTADPVTKNATVHIQRGIVSQLASTNARAARLEEKLRAKHQDLLIASLACAQYKLSLAELANEGAIAPDRIDFNGEIKQANGLLDSIESGKDPFAAQKGDLRKAYRSKVDSSLQPYRVFVPSSYDGAKPYPLIIALHGMGGDENSYFDAYANGAFKTEAEKHGYLVACPKGRQPASMYRGAAEQDVIDVISEMTRAYRIDPDRVYLTGHSMGGFGTWSVAMGHPDLFAALAPFAGGGNPTGMSKIAHIPQLVVHGDADMTVLVASSRAMVEAAKKLGVEVKYIEVPKGTHINVVVPNFGEVFDWFDAHKRRSTEIKAKAAGAKAQ